MPRRLVLLLVAAALAQGCASPPPLQPPPADSRVWISGAEGPRIQLMYGTPESDDIPLAFACVPGSGRVELTKGGMDPGEGIAVASDGRRATFHGRSEPDELNGGLFVVAETDAAAPVLQAFRATGRLSVVENGRLAPLHAEPSELETVRRFFAGCAKGSASADAGAAVERRGVPAAAFVPPGWRFMYPLQMASYSAEPAGRMDLLIDCDGGSLRVFRFPPPQTTTDRASLTVSSGAARTVASAEFNEGHPTSPTGEVFRDPAGAQPSLGADLPVTSPVVREFLRTGALSVTNSGRTLRADADPGELAEMRRYLARC